MPTTQTTTSFIPVEHQYIKHDPILCLAHHLFCADLNSNPQSDIRLTLHHALNRYEQFDFKGWEILTVQDLIILQGLSLYFQTLPPSELRVILEDTTAPLEQELRRRANLKDEAVKKPMCHSKLLVYRLLAQIGYGDSQANSKMVFSALERLSTVTVIYKSTKPKSLRTPNDILAGSTNLLSFVFNIDGQLHVALNYRMSEIVMKIAQSYALIAVKELQNIRLKATRIIHQRLCGWMYFGEKKPFSIETLKGYVWDVTTNKALSRKQTYKIKQALSELSSLGWIIKESKESKDIYDITRPKPTKIT